MLFLVGFLARVDMLDGARGVCVCKPVWDGKGSVDAAGPPLRTCGGEDPSCPRPRRFARTLALICSCLPRHAPSGGDPLSARGRLRGAS